MTRIFTLFLGCLLFLTLSACGDSVPNDEIPSPNGNGQPPITDDADLNGEPKDDHEDRPNGDANDNDEPLEDDDLLLATEWSSYYSRTKGNTSGNVNHGGRVTYDAERLKHYISSERTIFSYDVTSGEQTVLVELSTGNATHLNVAGDLLYFIHDEHGTLFSYDLVEGDLRQLLGGEGDSVFFLHRIQSQFQVLHDGFFGIEWGAYRPNDDWILDRRSGITSFSQAGQRALMRAGESLTIQLRDPSVGAGSNWLNFETTYNVTQLKDFLYLYYTQNYLNNVALILNTPTEGGVYVYLGEEDEPLIQVMSGNFDHFSNLNYDGTYVYFLHHKTLYRFVYDDPETLESYLTLVDNIAEIQVINHWIYYRIQGSNTFYQVHPDTQDVQAID